jgi:hypothetical protein
MPEGRQSPPPEAQKPAQIEVPSGGHGADQSSRESQEKVHPEDQLKGLESNPAEIMEKERERKFSKTAGN